MTNSSILKLLAATISLAATVSTASASETKPIVRDHRVKIEVRDHRTKRPNEVVVVSHGKYDCRDGVAQLYKMGFTGINPLDCDGVIYHYTAIDGSAVYKAAMSSHTDKIRLTMIGII